MAHTSVKIPAPLRPFADGSPVVDLEGSTVGSVLRDLGERFPPLRRHLLTSTGELRNFVTLYLNEQDVRYLQRGETALKDGDVLTIVPAMAGG